MKKISLVLVISASFITGTLVTGNFVFADPADGQNSLLGQILQAIQTQNNELISLSTGQILSITVTCPDNTQVEAKVENQFFPGSSSIFYVNDISSLGNFINIVDIPDILQLSITMLDGTRVGDNFQINGIAVDDICSLPSPTVITITGECGVNKEVEFLTDTGISATTTTNVACV